jgi:hypothetical protein
MTGGVLNLKNSVISVQNSKPTAEMEPDLKSWGVGRAWRLNRLRFFASPRTNRVYNVNLLNSIKFYYILTSYNILWHNVFTLREQSDTKYHSP